MTQGKFLFLSIFSVMSISTAHASEILDQALKARQEAQNRYYQAIKSLPTNATQQQMDQLKNEILGPSQAAYDRALQAEEERTQREFQKMSDAEAEKTERIVQEQQRQANTELSKLTPAQRKQLEENTEPPSSVADHSEPSKLGKPGGPVAPPAHEDVALDGQNIPKEIVFPGSSQKPAKSTQSPIAPTKSRSTAEH